MINQSQNMTNLKGVEMALNPNHLTKQNHSIWSLSPAWQGAWLKIISYVCFAFSNCIIRYWTGGTTQIVEHKLSVYQLLFFQNALAIVFLLPWIFRFQLKDILTPRPMLNGLRITTAIAGLGLWYLAIQYMPIAEAAAITFMGPIFTVIGARIFLKEKMSTQRLLSVILSLIGAYIIIKPHDVLLNSNTGFGVYALLPLGSAIALALDKLYTRKISQFNVKVEALVISFLLVMGPSTAILAYFFWIPPVAEHWKWLGILGSLTLVMHYTFVKAYMLAEISFLTPINFTKFFISAGVAYWMFAEIPKHWGFWVGTTVIFISILLLIERPKQQHSASRS